MVVEVAGVTPVLMGGNVVMTVNGIVLRVVMPVDVAASLPASGLVLVMVVVLVDVAVAASVPASCTVMGTVTIIVFVNVAVAASTPASWIVAVVVPVDVAVPASLLSSRQVPPVHARGSPHWLPEQHGWSKAPQGMQ